VVSPIRCLSQIIEAGKQLEGNSEGKPLAERVWEDGESEGRSAMGRIGIQNLSWRESVQTSIWCNSR
jgi:hypothetical protein